MTQWTESLTKHALPVIGHKRIDTVTTADVLAVLTPIWIEHPETSTRVEQRLGKVLDYSMAHGWRSDNPAALGRGTGHRHPGDGAVAEGPLRPRPEATARPDAAAGLWPQHLGPALLAWVISDRWVSSAIPTTSRPERIQENAQAAQAAGLPQQFREYIRSEAERVL